MSRQRTNQHGSNAKVVKQASFLMAAHLISSMIGLLYRSPLRGIMGDVGAGYYTFAYDWYTILLLISSYSIPSAVSKVMSERLAVRQYKNAMRIFRVALLYVLVVGLIGALFAYIAAPFLLRNTPDAVTALRILAPTIILSGFLGVFRGFFQAHNTMLPTAISQVGEQIMNAVFSILMAYLLIRPYAGDASMVAKYGAAGGTSGTLISVSFALLLMMLFYWFNRSTIRRHITRDHHTTQEPYRDVLKDILLMVTPIILSTFIYNMISIVDQRLFASLMARQSYSAQDISALYGLFGYQYKPIHNIPIALASATSTALIPAVASSMAKRAKKEAFDKIERCIGLTLFIAMPSAVGLTILAYPVIRLLYPGGNVAGASQILMIGACSVITFSLSTVMNGVLQSTGHAMLPVRNALIALVLNIVTLMLLTGIFKIGIYGVIISHVLYSIFICILNIASIRRTIGYRSEPKEVYLVPLLASLIMGIFVFIIYHIPMRFLERFFDRYLPSALLTLLSVLVGIVVYVIAYGKLSGKTNDEIMELPMGHMIYRLLVRLGVR